MACVCTGPDPGSFIAIADMNGDGRNDLVLETGPSVLLQVAAVPGTLKALRPLPDAYRGHPQEPVSVQGRLIVTVGIDPDWYSMLVPVTELTVNVDESVVNPMLLLVSVQLPVLPVMQVLAPPGAKLP